MTLDAQSNNHEVPYPELLGKLQRAIALNDGELGEEVVRELLEADPTIKDVIEELRRIHAERG